jgi:hypothetical protein
MVRYQSRWVGVGRVLGVIGGTFATPAVRGQDGNGPQGPVFNVRNESGQSRTIDVAGFPVVATENAFFLHLGVNGPAMRDVGSAREQLDRERDRHPGAL